MKFICNPTELADALQIVSKALSVKPNIPILEGIKIVAEGERITFSATDLEIFISKTIKAQVLLEGEAVVTGRFFAEFARKLTDLDAVEIEKYNATLTIKYKGNETEIQCLEEDSYPEIKNIGDGGYFIIKERELKNIISKTSFCVALDDARPVLKGCLLEVKGEKLTAVALDGYRLAVAKCGIVEATADASVIVPGRIINEIEKILEETDQNVTVNVQKNNVMFDLGHTKITTRLIEGEYMQYERIIPAGFKTKILINKDTFVRGLDRGTLITKNKKNNYLKLVISAENVEINGSSEFGKIRENVPCVTEGAELPIAFNSKYLFDAFNHIKEDFININFSGSNAPAVITPTEGESYKYIVLPVRIMG